MKKEKNYIGLNIKINSNNIINNFNLNTDKSLKIKIQNKEYEIYDQELIQILISLIMANGGINPNIKKNANNINLYNKKSEYREFCQLKKNLFSFPKELDKNTLELFINLLSKHIDKNPCLCAQIRKLINICILFQLYDIIKKEVNEFLLPKISKNNCIEIVINFIDLIFEEKIKNFFINLIKKGISTISYNLPEFIINKKESLYFLSNETLEEIIEIFFENKYKFIENCNYISTNEKEEDEHDIKNVLELLMYARNIHNDIFSLLENERKNALKSFEMSLNEDKDYKPKFIWKIKYCDIKNEMYQEYKICLDNINLLLISYFEPTKDIFQLALQVIGINKTPLNSKFNNNNYKNIDNNLINITESSKKNDKDKKEENNNEFELISYNNNEIDTYEKNNISLNDKNNNKYCFLNDIISILYSCELPEIGFKSKINFNCVQQNCSSKFLIFKLENFSKLIGFSNISENKAIIFSLKFYFTRNYIFSSIIEHICKNLEIYHKYFSVSKIPKLALSIILKNENIINSSKNESYKLILIKNWLKNKNNYNEKNIIYLFKLIKWPNLASNDLIEFFINNAQLLIFIKELKNDVFYEIQRRFQNEYLGIFQNDKILQTNLYNNTESNTDSIKLNNIPKIDNIENNNSFTFDFLTKILTNFSLKNMQGTTNEFPYPLSYKEINYTTPLQEGRNIYKLIKQRNNNSNYNEIPKPKISKSIRLNESPYYNNYQNNQKEKGKEIKHNSLNKRNTYTNNNSNKISIGNKNPNLFYINNLTNKKKKSTNSSIISNYQNNSAKNCEINDKYTLMQNINKKIKLTNNNHNNKIYSSHFMSISNLNGGKSSSLITSKSANRIMNKKSHSKSMDKNNYESSIHKNTNIPDKNNVYYLNNYLNDKENGQNQNCNYDKKINGLQNNNFNSNDKKTLCANNHSKAKLIKYFNSPFNTKRGFKKNSSENKVINTKLKKYNY